MYGSAYGSGKGLILVACQDYPYYKLFYNHNFVLVGSCSSNTATDLTCNHENDIGIRCSKGQCKFCFLSMKDQCILCIEYSLITIILLDPHAVDIVAIPKGSSRLGSSSFSLQCFAQQFPWNTTLISGGWYDADGNPFTSNSGPVSVDLLQNTYDIGGSGVNLTYTYRDQLNFNHPLRISDGGYYHCNVSVELTYPDNSTVKLSNRTDYLLIIEGKHN